VQSDKEVQFCNWRPNNLNKKNEEWKGRRKDSRGSERKKNTYIRTNVRRYTYTLWLKRKYMRNEKIKLSIHRSNVRSVKLLENTSHDFFLFLASPSSQPLPSRTRLVVLLARNTVRYHECESDVTDPYVSLSIFAYLSNQTLFLYVQT
jgi:hypothetical protein